jgi:hypothetical protein
VDHDVDGVVGLLTDDAWLRMPPEPFEYQGHASIAVFVRDGARLEARADTGWSRPAPTASPRSASTCATRTPRSRALTA